MATSLDVSPEENERRAAAILGQVQQDMGAVVFFEKPLTASDASGTGRVVIPKAIAEQYFPRLDQPSGLPVRAVDTRGYEYTFKFRFWINNQSRMYLLEGAGELHRQFNMVVGDVMVFAQRPDRALVVAGRPATKNDVIRKAPVKRPAGEPKERTKSGREPRAKQPRGATASTAAPTRKKARTGEQYAVPRLDFEPAVDGIFRALPNTAPSHEPSGVSPSQSNRWVVTLNLAGELYQALFDSQEDAGEAFNAAGGLDDLEAGLLGGGSLPPGMQQGNFPQPSIDQLQGMLFQQPQQPQPLPQHQEQQDLGVKQEQGEPQPMDGVQAEGAGMLAGQPQQEQQQQQPQAPPPPMAPPATTTTTEVPAPPQAPQPSQPQPQQQDQPQPPQQEQPAQPPQPPSQPDAAAPAAPAPTTAADASLAGGSAASTQGAAAAGEQGAQQSAQQAPAASSEVPAAAPEVQAQPAAPQPDAAPPAPAAPAPAPESAPAPSAAGESAAAPPAPGASEGPSAPSAPPAAPAGETGAP